MGVARSSCYKLLMYHIHIHTEHSNTWTHAHMLPSVMTNGATNTLCVLSHSDTCNRDYSPFSDPCRQQSSQAVILAHSAVIALSWRPLLSWRLTHFWDCLHSCRPRALSPFKFTQQSTTLPSCLLGKNIFGIILFECSTCRQNGFFTSKNLFLSSSVVLGISTLVSRSKSIASGASIDDK